MDKLHPTLRRIRLWIIGASLALVATVIGCLIWVSIDEKIPATGVVLAEQEYYLYAADEGVIQEFQSSEGAEVHSGDPILTLDSRDQENWKAQLQAEIKEATALLQLKQVQLEKISKMPLPREFWHARSELSEAEQKARHAAIDLERYQQLLDEKLASQSAYDERKLADELAKTELVKAHDRVAILDKGLEETIMKEALADLNSATARAERLKTDIHVCETQIERRHIRTPTDGRITLMVKRRTGERILKGEEIAHISRGEANRARLLVGESQVHRIQRGQHVRMKSNAFDFMRYGYIEGHVEEISLEPYPPAQRAGRDPANDAVQRGVYRVMAKIDRTPLPLPLGSSLDARIILRRTPLWQLLFPVRSR